MMHRTATFVLLLMAAVGCTAPAGEAPPTPVPAVPEIADLDADLATIVTPLLEKYNVPGVSVAVLVDGEIVLVNGFGRLRAEENSPAVDAHTVFQAASLSKPVFAYGVHRLLVKRTGGFDLDKPLTDYRSPDEPYDHDDPRLKKITARTSPRGARRSSSTRCSSRRAGNGCCRSPPWTCFGSNSYRSRRSSRRTLTRPGS